MNVLEALAAVSRGRLGPHDIARAVNADQMQLWQTPDRESVMLTELINYPQMRECRIISAAGENAQSWLPLWPTFEDWVRSHDCSIIKLEGRAGWKRILEPLGFEQTAIILEKALS